MVCSDLCCAPQGSNAVLEHQILQLQQQLQAQQGLQEALQLHVWQQQPVPQEVLDSVLHAGRAVAGVAQ